MKKLIQFGVIILVMAFAFIAGFLMKTCEECNPNIVGCIEKTEVYNNEYKYECPEINCKEQILSQYREIEDIKNVIK